MADINRTYADPDAVTTAKVANWRALSWSAIFAGVITSLVLQFLLNLLGIGIGASVIDPATTGTPDADTAGFAAYAWWAVSGIIAGFAGGMVAGFVVAPAGSDEGFLHGLVSWAATTLLIVTLIASMASGAMGTLSSFAGPVASQMANLQNVQQTIREQSNQDLGAGFTDPNQQAGTVNPDGSVNTAPGLPRIPAEQRQQLEQQAETAAEAVAQGAIWSFVALVIGAVAAAFGGAWAAGRPAGVPVAAPRPASTTVRR